MKIKTEILRMINEENKKNREDLKKIEDILLSEVSKIDNFFKDSFELIKQSRFNPNLDLEFLNLLILKETHNFILNNHVNEFLNNNLIIELGDMVKEENIVKISESILDTLSPLYRRVILPIYIDPDKLEDYIKKETLSILSRVSFKLLMRLNGRLTFAQEEIYEVVKEILSN